MALLRMAADRLGEPSDRWDYPFREPADLHEGRVRLPDGRQMGMARAGPDCREPIVYFHGILGSRLEPFTTGEPRHGVIALERPGYGWSDPMPEPSLERFGRDVEAALDTLGVGRCFVYGVSAGAPYALAAALQLGARVRKLFLVAGVAHSSMVRRAGLPMRLLVDFAELPVLREKVVPGLRDLLSKPLVANGWLRMTLAAEREFLPSPEAGRLLVRRLADNWLAGNARGPAGVQTDLCLLTTPWDIDHTRLSRPVRIVHGTGDPVVPPEHADWYRANLPDARLKWVPRRRHVSTVLFTGPKIVAMARWLERHAAAEP